MSADKCGTVITMEQFQEAVDMALEPVTPPPLVVSSRAYRVLQKIRYRYPEFIPSVEADIWLKAHKMGLTEDE